MVFFVFHTVSDCLIVENFEIVYDWVTVHFEIVSDWVIVSACVCVTVHHYELGSDCVIFDHIFYV